MKGKLILYGKTEESYLKQGILLYESRIRHYVPFEIIEIPALKNPLTLSAQELSARESQAIGKRFQPGDIIVLLDEKGKEMSSVEFSAFLNRNFITGGKNLVFAVGGPFGFDDITKKQASHILSLSRMTFSHQMVRLFFAEQLYRGMTIIRGESYHHE